MATSRFFNWLWQGRENEGAEESSASVSRSAEFDLHPPIGVSEIGKRKDNQDAIYPNPENATAQSRLFLVCDGVGGSTGGQMASSLIAKRLPLYLEEVIKIESEEDDPYNTALGLVKQELDELKKQHPEAEDMASTITLAHFYHQFAIIGWAGDSRVYHIRDGEISFQTSDHSLVNRLVALGEISPEEAAPHPQRNVITRAISGTDDDAKMDIHVLNDLAADDYLFLCTDGVLEALSNDMIPSIFQKDYSPEKIKESILALTREKSDDNYSFYLIKIKTPYATETEN